MRRFAGESWIGLRGLLPGLAAIVMVVGCERAEERVADLPLPAAERAAEVAPVPDELLPRDGHRVERVAVGPQGHQIYGSVRDEPDGDVRLVLWEWDEEAERWAGPESLHFSDGTQDDRSVSLAPDGSYLLFSSLRAADQPGAADYNVWLSQWEEVEEEGRWSDPWVVPQINSPAWDGTPALAGNGNLYLSSERDPDVPGRALYVAVLEDAMWHQPEALPDPVGGVGNDEDPWVAPDESFLLFASDREGAWNIYVTFRGEDGVWGEPEPLSSPVTSDEDERAPALSLGGEFLFFVRGDGELWWGPAQAAGLVPPTDEDDEETVAGSL